MATNYFANQNPTDIAIQSEDGGGMIFTKQGKFLFGAKLPEINEQLNEEFYQGNVDVNPNTNSSFIGIMNAQSEPINVDIPSTNQYSLFTPPENIILEPNPPKDDCDNEFNDAATVLLTWENDNTSRGDYNTAKNRTNDPAVYNGPWDAYGANGSGISNGQLTEAKKYFLDNYWNTNDKNTLDFSIASDAGPNQGNPKLLIKNLPPGLRIMAAQFNYNAKQWWARILAAVGEDWLGGGIGVPYRLTANLGPNGADSYEYLLKNGVTKSGKFVYNPYKVPPDSSKEFTLKGNQRIQLFIDQYDQIITLYNNDKAKFLSALKDETIRYYTALDQALGPNSGRLSFWLKYVEKAYNLALKYIDCPVDNQMTSTTVLPNPNQSTQSTPPPPPTPPVSLTAAEIEEGIYEANFLPASEEEGFQLFGYPEDGELAIIAPDDYKGPIKITEVKISSSGKGENKGGSQNNDDPVIVISEADLVELNTWVKFTGQTRKDYLSGKLNPNTLKDLITVCKSSNVTVTVTSAFRSGESQGYHRTGWALDVTGFNGLYNYSNDPGSGSKEYIETGNKLAAALKQLGYKQLYTDTNAERGQAKTFIWQSKQHYNHIHMSNRIEASNWTNPNDLGKFSVDKNKQ